MLAIFRTSKATLKETVPELATFDALKAHFDWLVDGQISLIVQKNLGNELKNLELYLRSVINY
jgi:hypothetical protein